MKKAKLRSYLYTATVLFLVVGVLHLTRVILGWELIIADWDVPEWFNIVVGAFVLSMSWGAYTGAKEL